MVGYLCCTIGYFRMQPRDPWKSVLKAQETTKCVKQNTYIAC